MRLGLDKRRSIWNFKSDVERRRRRARFLKFSDFFGILKIGLAVIMQIGFNMHSKLETKVFSCEIVRMSPPANQD